MTHNFSSPSIYRISTPTSFTYKRLNNRSLPVWLPTFSVSTLLKMNLLLLDLNNNSLNTRLFSHWTLTARNRCFIFDVTPYLLWTNYCTTVTITSVIYLYPPIPWLQNSRHPCHLHPSFKTKHYNSLYRNLPKCQLNRLIIQNGFARAADKAPISTHITPILKSLHWL